jgi:hypothetical protein
MCSIHQKALEDSELPPEVRLQNLVLVKSSKSVWANPLRLPATSGILQLTHEDVRLVQRNAPSPVFAIPLDDLEIRFRRRGLELSPAGDPARGQVYKLVFVGDQETSLQSERTARVAGLSRDAPGVAADMAGSVFAVIGREAFPIPVIGPFFKWIHAHEMNQLAASAVKTWERELAGIRHGIADDAADRV